MSIGQNNSKFVPINASYGAGPVEMPGVQSCLLREWFEFVGPDGQRPYDCKLVHLLLRPRPFLVS